MHGLHLTADLWGCRCADAWLLDAQRLGPRCVRAVREAGLHAVAQLFHTFPGTPPLGGGITATVLLAESHVCVHTWPERRAVTLDVYVCNVSADHSAAAQALLDALIALFEPSQTQIQCLQRGQPPTAWA
ncbi:MAG: adenosylmethionine decarboxylase [Rhodoferax sp.]